ncbi:MAG: hypothetical protein Q9217_003876 [Psora testacea]
MITKVPRSVKAITSYGYATDALERNRFANDQPFDPFAPEPTVHFPNQYHQQTLATMPKNGRMKSQDDDEFLPEQTSARVGRKTKKQKIEEDICEKPAPGVAEGIDVKTKFPVARIKRIMQADEDVGKVSQVTPTAVSKALELFIISMVLKSSAVARSKSSKRVTAAHLKQAVQNDEQMDFLADIVAKVPDAPTASSKTEGKKKGGVTEGEESSDEAYVERGEGKKRKGVRTGRRKRKGGSDD